MTCYAKENNILGFGIAFIVKLLILKTKNEERKINTPTIYWKGIR